MQNVSDSEPIWFWTFLISNLFDSEPFWFWTCLRPIPSDTEPIKYRTRGLLGADTPIYPAHNDHQPLLACLWWNWGPNRSTPAPSFTPPPRSAHNDRQPILAHPMAKLGSKKSLIPAEYKKILSCTKNYVIASWLTCCNIFFSLMR
jgi:hypothetical protein